MRTAAPPLVPIIDLEPFRLGGAESAAVVDEVRATCERSGFLVVRGHGVDATLIDEMHRATKAFFELPAEVKGRHQATAMAGNGFRPASSSSLARTLGNESPPDLCEMFHVSRFEPGPDPNRWPYEIANFEAAWKAYYAALEELSATLMRIFAVALELPEEWFDPFIDRHCTVLFANYYPPQTEEPEPGQLRRGAHTDFGSLTVLYQDSEIGGLQVADAAGEWHDVPAIPGTFIVNLGDLMARWTNDRWRSTLHRVVNPPRDLAGTSRISIPFFHQPNADALIECIPTCASPDDPPKYEPVRSGEWREMKVRQAQY